MTAKKSVAAKPAAAAKSSPAKKAAAPAKAEPVKNTKAAAATKPAKATEPVKAKAAVKPTAEAPKGKPGLKPKFETAPAVKGKKKSEELEVDLADIEADLEGEVEAEVAGVAEDTAEKVKAKPLRMKVSRAKERALMREFGLDETALTEEEVAKRRHELKTLNPTERQAP